MKVFEAVTQTLLEAGVDPLFGVMGDANMRIISTYVDADTGSYVGAAHEAGAVLMADGHARLTGTVGVATVTHGPGLTNALTALTNAVRAHSRLVVITGTTPPVPEHFQELDVRSVAQVAGAEYRLVQRSGDVVDDLTAALRFAAVQRHPVLLDIPAGVMDVEAGEPRSRFGYGPWAHEATVPADAELDAAIGVIAAANRPLILAGRGAVLSGAREQIFALSEMLHAPIANTVMAKGYLQDHPLSLGIFGNQAHSVAARQISQSDCLIVLGAGLNQYTTAGGDLLRNKAVVQCDVEPGVAGSRHPATVSVTADVKAFVERMLEALKALGVAQEPAWLAALRTELAQFDPAEDYVDRTSEEYVDLRTAMSALDAVLPANRSLVTDAGHFMTAPWRHLGCSFDGFAHSTSFGSIGLGLGMAIGAAFAHPERTTVCVVGDGGLMMAIQELYVAVQHRLPMVIVVADDGAYGAEYRKLTGYGHNPVHSLCPWPSFADVAHAFGAEGSEVSSVAEIERLADRLDRVGRGPLLLDIRYDPAVDVRLYK